MKQLPPEIEKEFDYYVKELRNMTHWGDERESPIFYFGGKIQVNNELFTIPDWGHIKSFLLKVYNAGIEQGKNMKK